ncbi:pseudouridine synthase [Mollisia scopiformis]|uniref:tRNA pseudouridine synthase 1 n=1 Tax=Mollisia scopiformis TaxID=149040 RepID=A0A132B3V0_MOLSC|nr:pseudouridine synthase [Mollisia scopiformis]KUJ07085.1 pseudouridine synthase [Mollisia scopiformis]
MADNPPAAQQAAGSGDSAPKTQHSSPTDSRGRGEGRNRGSRGRGRGDRGRGRGFGSKDQGGRNKKREVGRKEWDSTRVDRRQRNDDQQEAKRRKLEDGAIAGETASPFSKEEIEAESRKPKRKVAVMIGYAGTGYKGMQINASERTIEGDLFKAFVAAGAISKANADDPKKSSLVRCARTDKGVHAAGNVISLKLIVEDPNIVQIINEHLPPQIRVWGIERTNGAFSCYQTCDSRWYEYLIPTYSFLPPHPQSFLGKKLVESAEKEGVFETYQSLQEDVASFWKETEEKYVNPILEKLDPELREAVMTSIHSSEEENLVPKKEEAADVKSEGVEQSDKLESERDEGTTEIKNETVDGQTDTKTGGDVDIKTEDDGLKSKIEGSANLVDIKKESNGESTNVKSENIEESKSVLTPLEAAIKEVKAAYIIAKKAYRVSPNRKQRVQETLDCYIGTRNFHNYTIQKTFSDPSAKRVIRSFKVASEPVIINDTEWLSLKVHGQSFMMHQIRKMVAMAALVVRCGASKDLIQETYGPANISIPKAPSLGLLLERPVFDSYNQKALKEFMREKIDFDKYEKEMNEFKQREIYDRLFREEEKDHQFHAFFHHIDHFRTDYFLWITASGISAAKQSKAASRVENLSDDEADVNGEEG